jgi:hypothetical protein
MAAVHAADAGHHVILFESTVDGGRKILISGGGRCNVLPAAIDANRFVTTSSPHTLRNMLRSWPLSGQRAFFEQRLHVPLVLEAPTGKFFPVANRARVVRDALVAAARAQGAEWRCNARVVDLAPHDGGWRVATAGGDAVVVDHVIVASGGLSVPATGSSGFGLACLTALGHTVHPTYPALTPLIVDPPIHADLAGLSTDVRIAARSETLRAIASGGFLFTHRGYSGPAVLDVSHVVTHGAPGTGAPARIEVQWSAERGAAEWGVLLAPSARHVSSVLREALPTRLAAHLERAANIDGRTSLAQLTRADRRRLVDALTRFPLPWTGDEGYRKAEVTGGGVALDEVDPRTLESRLHPGLFLAGELLDAFGPIGGHNFAWAWATGRLAGIGASQ